MPRNYRTSLASRERNRIHARKTRQRKKEQMQNLQAKADCLKNEQLSLRQLINEKNTANILVGLFTKPVDSEKEDPRVEGLLTRQETEIPDASKVPELPALILPGQHASKRIKALAAADGSVRVLPDDGIDYDLLGKDRSKCSPEELDRIRRERNRMHAKRTRDRKRLFTEQMSEICRQLEEENHMLHLHLTKIDPDYEYNPPASLVSSDESSTCFPESTSYNDLNSESLVSAGTKRRKDQIGTLLQAASTFRDKRKRVDLALSVAQKLVSMSDDSASDDDDKGSISRLQRHHHTLTVSL